MIQQSLSWACIHSQKPIVWKNTCTPVFIKVLFTMCVCACVCVCMDFPSCVSGKEHACQCRRCMRHWFNPWVGEMLEMATYSTILAWRIPWTEEPGGLCPQDRKESDPTEWLTHTQLYHGLYNSKPQQECRSHHKERGFQLLLGTMKSLSRLHIKEKHRKGTEIRKAMSLT